MPRAFRRRFRLLAAACLAIAGASAFQPASAALVEPERPDAHPDLGLLRDDGAGGLTQGHVHALAKHPRGGVIVGGEFVQTGDGTVCTYLLRLRADGTLDPDFDVEIDSNAAMEINAIAVDDTGIYIGGRFQRVEGVERPALAKLTFDGELVEDWNAGLHGYDVIFAIAPAGDAVFAGGGIETADLWGLGKFDAATGALDPQWRAPTQTHVVDEPVPGWRGRVYALAYTGADLVVGGDFAWIAGSARRSVARLSLDAPVAVSPYRVDDLSGSIYALALDARSGDVYVAGNFFAGAHEGLMRTNGDSGAKDAGWLPQADFDVRAVALGHGHVYAGGSFDHAGASRLVRLRTDGHGAVDPHWLPLPDARVLALAWDRGTRQVWAGGEFVDVGLDPRNGLARFSFRGASTVFYDGLEDD